MRLFWKIIPWSGTAKRYGSQAMITSGPVLRTPPPSSNTPQAPSPPPFPYSHHPPTYRHKHAGKHKHTIPRTCWPVLLRRGEMLSNSAFQHSTSDYLFRFTGRFELVMYFPFSVRLASLSLSLFFCLSLAHFGNSSFPSARDPPGQKRRGQTFST